MPQLRNRTQYATRDRAVLSVSIVRCFKNYILLPVCEGTSVTPKGLKKRCDAHIVF